jgi:hypothetical protein
MSKCLNTSCKKHPSFNNEGEIFAIYCSEHKETKMVNVKSKKCNHASCLKVKRQIDGANCS